MKNCPNCGAPSPVHDTRDVPYTYKNQDTLIPAVAGHHCTECGEVILDRGAVDRFSELVGQFQAKVNADLIDPMFILTVRKKLRLGQREAGEIFGGGVNAFSRYETGKAQPHPSTIQLLKLLDRHPELLAEMRGEVLGSS
jgi:HTH-type transcriptional regulator/antitoxin MqsA